MFQYFSTSGEFDIQKNEKSNVSDQSEAESEEDVWTSSHRHLAG